ncbi:hypothetical protein G6F16_004263 [Rhizopus arrhizus]|nr:hypothetical protein G6F23_010675 [Rhizopus arrhizus]KAG0767599.1 hypothetical protein G6F24_002650 [Rhizopus arrhizus]KAG0786060.1 hypothetical protein G6F21_008852 [Rhizopus arrhizus]KAG0809273.1 hypothetical protein G6F20_008905 [Rhizopus arrhizus]KAG0825997.1 hypothetical protein G6F19_009514 [Rhizopus arrhizus]
MMLPQFGFIVAQAGADSHTLSPNPNTTTTNNNHSLAPLLTSIHKPSLPFKLGQSSGQVPFYSRQPSPAPPSNTTALLPPLLPPPAPYLFNSSSSSKSDHVWYSRQQPSLPNNNHINTITATTTTTNNTNNTTTTITSPHIPRYAPPLSLSQPHHQHQPQQQQHGEQEEEEEEEEEEEYEELFDKWKGQYNNLMTWMDNEFWEQADEIYQEKITNLQQELVSLQKGTHSVYQELIADIELKREEAVMNAEFFMNYQLSFIETYFNKDVLALEEEYESEKRQIQESLIASLEDRRRQIKDQEQEEGKGVKRNLRKRNHDSIALSNHPIKEQATKKRAVRPSTLPNIYTISQTEEDELENEFLNMKKMINTTRIIF